MVYSGDRGKLIHEKNLKSNISYQSLFNGTSFGEIFQGIVNKSVRVPFIQYYCLEFVSIQKEDISCHCLGRKDFHSFSSPYTLPLEKE